MEAQHINVALIDSTAGYEASSDRVRVAEFVEYAPALDDEALARLTRGGAVAWRDVPDATARVDELRGRKS